MTLNLACSRNGQKVIVLVLLGANLKVTQHEAGEADHVNSWTFYLNTLMAYMSIRIG